MNDGYYETAQVCLGGHLINPMSLKQSVHNKRFCERCGQAATTKCQRCTAAIRGPYQGSSAPPNASYTLPSYCHNCGSPYPWTRPAQSR